VFTAPGAARLRDHAAARSRGCAINRLLEPLLPVIVEQIATLDDGRLADGRLAAWLDGRLASRIATARQSRYNARLNFEWSVACRPEACAYAPAW
jgi:hypothetical protein